MTLIKKCVNNDNKKYIRMLIKFEQYVKIKR